jgi:hydrogenase maturation protease
MVAPVLLFAVGNESRGDDALGVLLLRELGAWLTTNKKLFSGLPLDLQSGGDMFELLEDFQLQVEHAIDMKDRRLVLFIDAGMDTITPFSFYRAQPINTSVLYSHSIAPETLLKVYTQFYCEAPPDVFILCIRGESFELGEGLSEHAADQLATAIKFSKRLLQAPEVDAWDQLCELNPIGHCNSFENNLSV